MDERMRSCKRSVGEMGAVAEVESGGGARTRGTNEVSNKRRSHGSQLVNVPINSLSSSAPANSTASSLVYTVQKESSDVVTSGLRSAADPKPEDSETEGSAFNISETSASSELCRGDTEEVMDSSSTKKNEPSPENSQGRSKMPTEAEIDEFFSRLEKELAKRFAEKYNYDIVNDIPLEGRYEWVRLWP